MADFDRNADFKRTLRQLREMGVREYIPLGGDILSGAGAPSVVLNAKHQADAAAMTLKRYIEQAKIEEKRLSGGIVNARTAEQRLRLASSGDVRGSLTQQLQADGFGKRGSGAGTLGGPLKISKGLLSRRGMLRAVGGTPLLVTTAAMHLFGAGLNTIADVRDEYKAVKTAGGTHEQAMDALKGQLREKAVSGLMRLGGADTISEGLGRLSGLSGEDSKNRFTRFWSKALNESGFQRRELAAANVVASQESETAQKFAKLDASSPKTFRLRNKAEATAYQQERRTANDLALTLGIFKEARDKSKQSRNAGGG